MPTTASPTASFTPSDASRGTVTVLPPTSSTATASSVREDAAASSTKPALTPARARSTSATETVSTSSDAYAGPTHVQIRAREATTAPAEPFLRYLTVFLRSLDPPRAQASRTPAEPVCPPFGGRTSETRATSRRATDIRLGGKLHSHVDVFDRWLPEVYAGPTFRTQIVVRPAAAEEIATHQVRGAVSDRGALSYSPRFPSA